MIILFLAVAINTYAAGTSSSSWEPKAQENKPAVSLYDQGVQASKDNNFQKALDLFNQALQANPSNSDIFNMLAHVQLKLGMIDESLENYKKALELRPNFPEAREYLGEAYIQAALREIKTLQSYGGEAGENFENLTKAFKDAAAGL
ncbi:MAG: tetratricopeptide repeat protein [Candidatus Omnitrophica bacterium]|nr:tetratricopeptide repeat protein [Candidatus Omnitrophota bacterium]